MPWKKTDFILSEYLCNYINATYTDQTSFPPNLQNLLSNMKVVEELKTRLQKGPISYDDAIGTLERISDLKVLLPALNLILVSKQMSKGDLDKLNALNTINSNFSTVTQLYKLGTSKDDWASKLNQLAAISPPSIRKRFLERLLTMVRQDTIGANYGSSYTIKQNYLIDWIQTEIKKIK